jgi:H3 lysine-79-specific histone-lysine N-methyltransferase
MDVAQQVVDLYFTKEQRKTATATATENEGILRKVQRTRNLLQADKHDPKLQVDFKEAVDAYNITIKSMMKDGSLARNLDKVHSLPIKTVRTLLQQVYDRAVSPQVDILKKRHAEVENEKDNTYGELRPDFVSEALTLAGLKSDQVFVDLGSGVGNVVLQAALEFGCESFGCEMVDNADKLAQLQSKEFATRCQMWGIKSGKVQLEHGSFFDNGETIKAISRADVILVNNEVFSADTNNGLVHMFLDCKDGCKIVSLQPFVEPGHEITDRNQNDPRHQLEVEQQRYYQDWVSWKSEEGDYYISTKNSKRVEAFTRRHGLP